MKEPTRLKVNWSHAQRISVPGALTFDVRTPLRVNLCLTVPFAAPRAMPHTMELVAPAFI